MKPSDFQVPHTDTVAGTARVLVLASPDGRAEVNSAPVSALTVSALTVMDAGQIMFRFEAVAHGATGSADPLYPEIEAAVDGTLDLSTLPAVTVNGGDNLFAAYSAAAKNSTALPEGTGQVFVTFVGIRAGVPDADLAIGISVGDISGSVVGAFGADLSALFAYPVNSTDTYHPVPFAAPSYVGGASALELFASTVSTAGSWLVTVTFRITGFIPATARDQIVD